MAGRRRIPALGQHRGDRARSGRLCARAALGTAHAAATGDMGAVGAPSAHGGPVWPGASHDHAGFLRRQGLPSLPAAAALVGCADRSWPCQLRLERLRSRARAGGPPGRRRDPAVSPAPAVRVRDSVVVVVSGSPAPLDNRTRGRGRRMAAVREPSPPPRPVGRDAAQSGRRYAPPAAAV